MGKIKEPPSHRPVFPWGGPRSLRERLVDPSQLERVKTKARKGDPKNPALPSAALMEFIGPPHSAEELRLPWPPQPPGLGAELSSFVDRSHLQAAVERGSEEATVALHGALGRVSAAPERTDELVALLGREQRMLERLTQLQAELVEIQRRVREEQRETGY